MVARGVFACLEKTYEAGNPGGAWTREAFIERLTS